MKKKLFGVGNWNENAKKLFRIVEPSRFIEKFEIRDVFVLDRLRIWGQIYSSSEMKFNATFWLFNSAFFLLRRSTLVVNGSLIDRKASSRDDPRTKVIHLRAAKLDLSS